MGSEVTATAINSRPYREATARLRYDRTVTLDVLPQLVANDGGRSLQAAISHTARLRGGPRWSTLTP